MSEFWVSKKKYFCKYCDIYIADDAPSRQQHENGLRHKGNKDRFIRELYKNSEKKKKDKEEEDREMKRVEQAARAAYEKDTGQLAPESSKPKPIVKPVAAKSSDPWANYSTAESLGFIDEDAEAIAEAAQLRQSEGRAGEWSTVSVATHESVPSTSLSDATVGQKRARTPPLPDGVPEEEDTRRYKMKQRTAAVGLGEIWEPGVIKVKRKEDESGEAPKKEEETDDPSKRPTNVPDWQPLQWKKSTKSDDSGPKPESNANVPEQPTVVEVAAPKQEDPPELMPVLAEVPQTAATSPAEHPASSGGSIFRKRKIASNANRGTKRNF